MKRTAITLLALLPALCTFAYYRENEFPEQKMTGFAIFTLIVMIVYIILSIVILVRWWSMTTDVKEIKQHLTQEDPK